jgi:hypothetical protein
VNEKVTIGALKQMKRDGRKIVGVVAWDYQIAAIADRAGVEIVSVGDSVGVNLWGHRSPLEVTMEQMLIACQAVRRAVSRALVSVDIPVRPGPGGRCQRRAGRHPDGKGLGRALWLTEPLFRTAEPEYVTFSGGVAEYLFGHETEDHGDIARDLAAALDARLRARLTLPLVDPGQRIRATVIGASQFSAQLSGSTIHLGGLDALPLRNVPVVRLDQPLPGDIDPGALAAAFERRAARQDVDVAGPVALAFSWSGPISYPRLAAVARAITRVAGPPDGQHETSDNVLITVVDADIAQSLGAILTEETGLRRRLIVLDGVELTDFDFVDVGEYLNPPGVLPVLIKSLLFAADVGDAGLRA